MRIAFLLRKFPVLSETFIINQIVGLISRGHEVDIYAIYKGHNIKHKLYQDYHLETRTTYAPNVPISPIKRALKIVWIFSKYIKHLPILLRCLNFFQFKRQAFSLYLVYLGIIFLERPKKYDVIHCHFGLVGLIGCDLKSLGFLDGKLVTSFHGMDLNTYPQKHGLDVYQRLFNQGDLFTTNSNFSVTRLISLGCPQRKICKIPMGVDISRFSYHSFEHKDKDRINLISVGRLVECKGLKYSIQAVASLKSKYPKLNYKIIGDGPLLKPLQILIDRLGAEEYIQLLGSHTQERVQKYYQEAHFLLFPSIVDKEGAEEGQGLVVQEAQASGLPVIATDIGGISDGLIDRVTGFLVPPASPQAIAVRLKYLCDNPALWQDFSHNGRAFVAENFNLDILNKNLESRYQEICGYG
ncbi:glycosyltransferase [Leptothoe kymatousa]|uniref:Glycosyltransferase n=1 Tax=Leptothoe kymatousa TAU-MAC 1615 TaxID=2364775 RepID=A0ABS5Y0N3_9CYAN|nr:glycosyltransferase [Leptothoe kymatousa]MBT9311366.1 glycosyltransferase [Leptothoe kymatousa TAU-MAC 1615]